MDRVTPAGAGGTLIAARGNRLVHCAGFGLADREERVRARCDTVYDVMSMTKQFTAAAILKLEMLGKLNVADPIGRHIRWAPADMRELTLHQLLTHTSGLAGSLGDDYAPLSRRELLTRAFRSRLRSEPGARYHYSNLGYSLLAVIVEKAAGTGYEEFLAEHLFAPANMRQTGYVLPDWDRDRVAVEYDARRRPQGRPLDHPWAADGPYWNLRGNGGLLSTARDMFRWHVALEGESVLDRGAKEQLFAPYALEAPGGSTYYGYGWVIEDAARFGRIAWHDGGNGWSFGLLTRFLDDGRMVFWVTNRYRDRAAGWSFYRFAQSLTEGVAGRL